MSNQCEHEGDPLMCDRGYCQREWRCAVKAASEPAPANDGPQAAGAPDDLMRRVLVEIGRANSAQVAPVYSQLAREAVAQADAARALPEPAGCDECGKTKAAGWALYCVACMERALLPKHEAKVMVCGVDCFQGDANCNGYCTGKRDDPPPALAARGDQAAEPVAWRIKTKSGREFYQDTDPRNDYTGAFLAECQAVTPLYTTPPAPDAPEPAWQPIETAPRCCAPPRFDDAGPKILGFCGGGGYHEICLWGGPWQPFWIETSEEKMPFPPTHWMPLPAAPGSAPDAPEQPAAPTKLGSLRGLAGPLQAGRTSESVVDEARQGWAAQPAAPELSDEELLALIRTMPWGDMSLSGGASRFDASCVAYARRAIALHQARGGTT